MELALIFVATVSLCGWIWERSRHLDTRIELAEVRARLAKFGVKPKDAKGRFVKGEG